MSPQSYIRTGKENNSEQKIKQVELTKNIKNTVKKKIQA